MKTQGKVWIIYDSDKKEQTKPMSVVQAQVILLSLQDQDVTKLFIWTPGWTEWVSIHDFLLSEQNYFTIAQPPKPKADSAKKASSPQHADHDAHTITKTTGHSNFSAIDPQYTHVTIEGAAPRGSSDEFGYHHQDFNGDELDLSQINKIDKKSSSHRKSEDLSASQDRRKNTRHEFKIEVVLVAKAGSFRTYSKNISLSGTMLEDEIPKSFLNLPFDLIIVNPFEADPRHARLLFRAKIVGDFKDSRRLTFIEQDVEMTRRLDALLKAYVAYQQQIKKTSA